MPIKSVHITNYYHKTSGGIGTSYNNLLDAANRHSRYIRLIVPGAANDIEEVGEFGKIYYVRANYSPIFDRRYRVMMPWQYMFDNASISKILLDEQPDMIEITDKYTLSLIGPMIRTNNFKMLGRPMLVHFSCERMDDNIGSFLTGGKFGKWLARRVMSNYNFPNFDFHIANSAYTAEEFYRSMRPSDNPRRSRRLLNACWRFFKAPRVPPGERIYVCPRGIDSQHFTPERRSPEARGRLLEAAGIPEGSVVMLYAGRVSPEKNIGLLVEMMSLLAADRDNDYRLLIAGDGPRVAWLRDRSEKVAGGKIVILGHLDKDILADHYANADLFVHPNPREPFGIAPLEAMASGVPVLAPNGGGILTYATKENAWLVEPKAAEFAAAARSIITDADLREKKVGLALAVARKNTRELATDRLLEAYDKMYDDFITRNELYTNRKAAGEFDFVGEFLSDS